MPSKALLRPVELAREVARVPGLATGPLDVPAVLARRDEVIHIDDDSTQLPWLEERGVTLVRGRGRLDGERRVVVGDEELVARKAVVVATGSAALIPDIAGLRDARRGRTSRRRRPSEVPPRLAVLGGGVVGVELSQAWSTFGSQVTLVHRGDRLIEREEPFAAEPGARRAARRRRRRAARAAGRPRHARRRRRASSSTTARRSRPTRCWPPSAASPRTADIGLETVGLEAGGPLAVGDDIRVPGPRLALRDRRRQRARPADAHGQVPGPARRRHDPRPRGRRSARTGARSPRVIFTDPQVGAVGLTLEARAGGGPARPARRRRDERERGRLVRRPRAPRAPRASWSTRSGA